MQVSSIAEIVSSGGERLLLSLEGDFTAFVETFAARTAGNRGIEGIVHGIPH